MSYSDPAKQRAYQRTWLQHRRSIAIDFFGGRCVQCGAEEDLQFDHIDPATKLSHAIWSWSRERMLAELRKCQLLCRPCHQKKTAQENSRPIRHGTSNGYKRGCRCHECTWSHTESRRRQRGTWGPRGPCGCQECRGVYVPVAS